MIGPASMYAMQHDRGNPFRNSRRITTTMPHSHIGKIKPKSAPIITAGTTDCGRNFVSACCGRNSSRIPAITAPRTMNGIASHRIELKSRIKSEIWGATRSPSWEASTPVLRSPGVAGSGGSVALSGRVVPGASLVVNVRSGEPAGQGSQTQYGREAIPHCPTDHRKKEQHDASHHYKPAGTERLRRAGTDGD